MTKVFEDLTCYSIVYKNGLGCNTKYDVEKQLGPPVMIYFIYTCTSFSTKGIQAK